MQADLLSAAARVGMHSRKKSVVNVLFDGLLKSALATLDDYPSVEARK